MKKHLAIFSKSVIPQIFNGQKTVETRFSQKRIPPFGDVSVGDLVYIKESGEEIRGQFKVTKVLSFEGIDPQDWQLIKSAYGKALSLGSIEADEAYFKSRTAARYGTIIFMDQVEQFITSPVKFTKKDLRGWVVLEVKGER